jgi:hypothetical protein
MALCATEAIAPDLPAMSGVARAPVAGTLTFNGVA